MKLTKYILLGVFAFILTACSNMKDEKPITTGYITDINKEAILVVSAKPKDTTSTDNFYDAIWFKVEKSEKYEVGDFVAVFYDGVIAESYPGQAGLAKIEKAAPEKPKGSPYTEAQAIQIAIEQQKESLGENTGLVSIVQTTDYNEELKEWTINLLNGLEEDSLRGYTIKPQKNN